MTGKEMLWEKSPSYSGEDTCDAVTIREESRAELLVQKEDQISNYKWYNVNIEFLPAKICHFMDSAKKLTYLPNLILFLTSLGLSKSEAGIILGFRYLFKYDTPYYLQEILKFLRIFFKNLKLLFMALGNISMSLFKFYHHMLLSTR